MGLTAKFTTERSPTLRPGQRIRRSVAASHHVVIPGFHPEIHVGQRIAGTTLRIDELSATLDTQGVGETRLTLQDINRIRVAPVRKRRKRVARKIAKRFGILHYRDVPAASVGWDIGGPSFTVWTLRHSVEILCPDVPSAD